MYAAPHNFSAPFAQSPVPASLGQFPSPQAATSGLPHSLPPNMTSLSASSTPGAKPGTASPGSAGPGAGSPQEKARVSTLLEINSLLLREVVNLQNAGKARTPAQQGQEPTDHSDASKSPPQKPSQEYFECMRRLQANLGYLATIADRAKKSGGVPPSAPSITTPPPNMPTLNEPYARLSELCPKGSQGGTPQPHSQRNSQGNGKSSPSIGESVV